MANQYPPPIRHFRVLWLLLLLGTTTWAQSTRYTLQGRVTDSERQALPGTTVVIVGTQLGTTTDADGNYTFPVTLKPGPITVAFTAIGYETLRQPVTLATAEQVTVNAQLTAATTNLDEVVVTGSTLSAPKRELGNAISTIKADALKQTGSGNLINSLQGKVPGAQITQNSDFYDLCKCRGISFVIFLSPTDYCVHSVNEFVSDSI